MQKQKIIQIIPADNWKLQYENDRGIFTVPLICFALVENTEGDREIKGVYKWGKETCFCEDNYGFDEYIKER